MPARLLPLDERRRRSRATQALDSDWTARQVAAGVDGPVPDGSPAGSDYNQHVPALEASAKAEDEFWARMADIRSQP